MANDKKVETAQGEVARGRTVVIKGKSFGPGEKISLESEEINRLRELGFLVDPNAPEIPRGEGPTFEAKEGPGVKVAA